MIDQLHFVVILTDGLARHSDAILDHGAESKLRGNNPAGMMNITYDAC
jgi:hypothetical protein